MKDEQAKASKPTPLATLEQKIMDCRLPKSEAEWWAHRRIKELEEELTRRATPEPDSDLATKPTYESHYAAFTDGMKAAAEICASLAETTYDDADGFEAAIGCEASIMRVVQQQRQEQASIATPEPSGDLVEIAYEAARPHFHYAKKGTPDAHSFDRTQPAILLRKALPAIIAAIEPQIASAAREDEHVAVWRPMSDTDWVDGRDVVLFAHEMEVAARFCKGEWSEDTPIAPAEYSGAVWSAFDDAIQFEIEETGHDPAEWNHGPVTHWREPKPPIERGDHRENGDG